MKYIRFCVLYIIIGTLISFTSLAAESRLYNSGDISSSLITSAIQDNKGHIWIGTEYGLNKSDGINIKEYYESDSPNSLMNNSIRDIYCDSEGRVWVGMITGMQLYDESEDEFRTVRFEGTSYTPNVSLITELSDGRIWIIVSRLGIFEVDPRSMTAYPLDYLKELCGTDHFNNIHEDKLQRVWIGTDEDGIFCLDKKHENITQYKMDTKGSDLIDHIGENSNGIIIAACDGRIWMFDEVRHAFFALEQPEDVYLKSDDFLLRRNGDFLIATTNNGLWKINEFTLSVSQEILAFPSEISQGKTHMVTLMEDSEENLWCGCFQRGVVMVPPPTAEGKTFDFWDISTIENLGFNKDYGATSAIAVDSDGHLWCGTQDGSIFSLDNKGKIKKRYRLKAAASCIFEDSGGNIWIGTENFGLCRMDTSSGNLYPIKEMSHMRISTVIEDKNNTLYIGTHKDGIWKYNFKTRICEKLDAVNPENYKLLRNSYINSLLIDSNERLWIGHFLGASCYDLKSRMFLEVATSPVLNSSVGYTLAESEDGRIWIGTNNGVFVWDDNKRDYERLSAADGLSCDMICGLAVGADGEIWCSTFRGINMLSLDGNQIQSFSTGNGSSRHEFKQGLCCSFDNRIYFGDSNGITTFTPPVTTSNVKRAIYLTDLSIGNQSHVPGKFIDDEILKFTYKQNTITLGFSTMAIRDAENIRFKYRLNGLDNEWYTTSYGFNKITYSHLPSGKYTLEICAEENSATSPTYSWKIEVGRPWYRSIIAYLIYIIVISLAFMFLYITIKRKQREEANEKKLKYYVNMAHEIRSPMVLIMNPLEKLLMKEENPQTRHSLNTMKRNSMRVIRLMDHFLDIRKLDKGQMNLQLRETYLAKAIKETLDTFAYEAEKRNISIVFDYPMDHMLFNVDPDHIDTIIFNLVANAMKYTPDNGEIKVCLSLSETYGNIEISVQDSGPGIDSKDIDKIFRRFYQTSNKNYSGNRGFGVGLNLCLMLTELHNGTISVSNRTDRSGSIFTVVIPSGIMDEEGRDKISETSQERSKIIITEQTDKVKKEKKHRVKSSDRILIIEDDDEIRRYLEETLSSYYRVSSEKEGNSGLNKALSELPDLIISDVMIPELDGLQLVKRIKTNPNTIHIPVILITSKSDISEKILGLEYGADAYMTKPFNMDELEIRIDNLLKNRQRMKGKYSGAHQEDKIKTIEIVSNSDKLMERIMAVINNNLENPDLKVEMLSEEVGLSRAQLHRRMKEMTGISAGEFIRNIRLKKAAELLSERKINVSQIAYMVGFSSQTHFSTAFRKYYGVSPTEYISKAK